MGSSCLAVSLAAGQAKDDLRPMNLSHTPVPHDLANDRGLVATGGVSHGVQHAVCLGVEFGANVDQVFVGHAPAPALRRVGSSLALKRPPLSTSIWNARVSGISPRHIVTASREIPSASAKDS